MHKDSDLAIRAYENEHQLRVDSHRLLIRIVNAVHEMRGEVDPVRLAKIIEPATQFVTEHCHRCGGKRKIMNGHGMVRCPECQVVGI